MSHQAVVFDLDGTLLDTLAEIAGAANAVLAAEGFPPHPVDAYRRFVGDGAAVLFRRALPPGPADDGRIARCVEAYKVEYLRRGDAETAPYAGIPELLDALSARGLALAILSNKKQEFLDRCVADLLPRWHFGAVLGDRAGRPLKPDPAGALEAARALGVGPSACLYLGDSDVDMQTARRAGMDPIGAGWGFRTPDELRRSGARAVLDAPIGLLGLLDGPPGDGRP